MNPFQFKKFGLLLSHFLLVCYTSPIYAQTNQLDRLFLDVSPDTFITTIDTLSDSLNLPHQFIIPRSEKIFQNRFKLLRGINYRIEEKYGIIFFKRPLVIGDSLTVIYQKYPFPLIPEYQHRQLKKVVASDTSEDQTVTKIVKTDIWEEIDSFSSNLERSGSIVRGIEIGNNRDLTLNSGLNLQLSGYITPEVQIVAALTDESTPIQPEGNTQILQEVDKVFVKITSPYLGGTLGDFNLAYRNTFFGNVSRKLQGITATGKLDQFFQQLTYATSRGTFQSNQFLGQEGNQGPYQLTGKNGEREILVLAGTEKVFVNGRLQIRGENNQYIIDYSLGQITFTNNLLVTGEDRIEVDFEYSNVFQRYGKNFIGFSSANRKSNQKFRYDLRLFREWDDTNNLLEDSAPLSEEEKEVLARAGDNQLKASVSGADSVGPGNGNYSRRDTLINEQQFTYFSYVGDGKGEYIVRFSSVGRGNGSYVRERLAVFRFVGPGLGEYLPIRLIPLAGDNKIADIGASYQIGQNLIITGEGALTDYERNVFSDIDNENNFGHAFTMGANFLNTNSSAFGKNLGQINWQFKWQKQKQEFAPLDRQFRPEFNYKWNLTSTQLITDENKLESNLFYQPASALNVNFDGGWIERGANISSKRLKGELIVTDSTLIKSNASYELVSSKDSLQKSDWQRSVGLVGKMFGNYFPYLDIHWEDRKVDKDGTNLTGFVFQTGGFGFKIRSLFGFKWHLKSVVRDDYLYDPDNFGNRLKLSRSFTHQFLAGILDSEKWQGRISFVFRDKKYESFFKTLPADSIPKYQPDPQFQDTSWIDRQSHLARIELRFRNDNRTLDSRWQYRIASELQALQEKVFLKVEENRGNYRFDEDLQEFVPDPQGEYLQIVVPTGNFESITNIEASWQIRYRPKVNKKKYEGVEIIIRNISFFSLLKINEKSREPDIFQLYLLNPQKIRDDENTLRGSYSADQDIYFFERNPEFGFTLRSRYRDNLSNEFVDAGFNETRRNWDRSVIWRQSLWKRKLTQEAEFKQNLTNRSVASVPSRNRDILGNILILNYKYRPVYAWQFQLRFEGALQEDRSELNQISVRYLEFRPQVNYSVAGKARALANATVLDVRVVDNPRSNPIPFEMGKGKKEGVSLLWNLRFEYFISSNITTTFNLTGRKDAGAAKTIFLSQAEVRAFF